MARTRVKFCGVTDPADARLAAELGADAVGMVLHADARRKVDLDTAERIVQALPPYVTPVGLFVDPPIHTVYQAVGRLGLRTVQLHGDEDAETVNALGSYWVIKALRVGPGIRETLDAWRANRPANLVGILLDGASGGSGVANDFGLIRTLQAEGQFDGLPPVVLAGGLTPSTVGPLVRELRPYAVDVSSGIEIDYGRKDADKMRAFVEAVRAARSNASTQNTLQ